MPPQWVLLPPPTQRTQETQRPRTRYHRPLDGRWELITKSSVLECFHCDGKGVVNICNNKCNVCNGVGASHRYKYCTTCYFYRTGEECTAEIRSMQLGGNAFEPYPVYEESKWCPDCGFKGYLHTWNTCEFCSCSGKYS